jgi:hypothetical protein
MVCAIFLRLAATLCTLAAGNLGVLFNLHLEYGARRYRSQAAQLCPLDHARCAIIALSQRSEDFCDME